MTEEKLWWTDRVDDCGYVLVLAVIGVDPCIVTESLSSPSDRDATHSPDQLGNERIKGMHVAEATRDKHQR